MYRMRKPSESRIHEFIEVQSRLEFTYPSVGATSDGDHPTGSTADHNRIHLGAGQAIFDAARRALGKWEHYPDGWIELHRQDLSPPAAHQTVAVLARASGL